MPMRVLVVDDSPVIRMIIARILRTMGVQRISEAGDGQEAWVTFQVKRPALVIVDWHLPVCDGLELTKRIRLVDPHVPIVMVTIVNSRSSVLEAIRAGITDYICKPFGHDELTRKLDRFIPVQRCVGEPGSDYTRSPLNH